MFKKTILLSFLAFNGSLLTSNAQTFDDAAYIKSIAVPADNIKVSRRLAVEDRLFVSDVIERKIKEIRKLLKDAPYLAWMFENCFPNTLDTTVHYTKLDDGTDDTFVYTCDIHAMWLRDSGAQVWSYVQFANQVLRRYLIA